MTRTARAAWIVGPGRAELRALEVADPGPGEVLVRTRWSGVSRGTESLVAAGRVPADQHDTMRAPHQQGSFPAPVKYGYLNVGTVRAGVPDLVGRSVFCLYPHQTEYVVPAEAVVVLPDDVPAPRAVLIGTIETALNAIWDAGPHVGDTITVVGAGMVGCCVARLSAGIPGTRVVLVDPEPARADLAHRLGVAYSPPGAGSADSDVVFHTSATSSGLEEALSRAAAETAVIDLSWYGDRPVQIRLGGRFHSDRLSIRSSQVGRVAPARAGRRTPRDRLHLAASLARDSAYDAMLSPPVPFAGLPDLLMALAAGDGPGLCPLIDYGEEE